MAFCDFTVLLSSLLLDHSPVELSNRRASLQYSGLSSLRILRLYWRWILGFEISSKDSDFSCWRPWKKASKKFSTKHVITLPDLTLPITLPNIHRSLSLPPLSHIYVCICILIQFLYFSNLMLLGLIII